MARPKKTAAAPKANKDELLNKALVPEDEQPYKVPSNWCWTYLREVSTIVTGNTPRKNHKEFYGGTFPFYKPEDLDTGKYVSSASEYLSESGKAQCRIIPKDSTIVCCIGSIGKCGLLNIEGATNQQINSIIPKFNHLYLYYFCSSLCFINQLLKKACATTIAIVNKTKMGSCFFPLPPLAEQQRIVERIESLFSKLDAAKERIQNALDGCELRKAAILKKAFNGELTEQWRKEHGEDLKSWQECSIAQLCSALQYGTSNKSQPSGEVAVLRMGNLQNGEIDWTDLVYTDNQQDIKKYLLVPGDVLFNRTNSSVLVGKTSIYRGEQKAIFAGYLIKLDYYRDRVLGDFLNYALNTSDAREYCNRVKTDGVNQSNINAQKIGAYTITVPTMPEQKEIVRLLDGFFEKERTAKEAAEQALAQIEYIKKSILAKAFRDELGTNDPQDESSLELLKQIIETGNS